MAWGPRPLLLPQGSSWGRGLGRPEKGAGKSRAHGAPAGWWPGGWAGEPRVCRIRRRARPGLSCRPRSAAVNAGMGAPPPASVAGQCLTRRSVFLNPDAEGATQHLPVAGLRAFGGVFPKVKIAVYFFQIGQHNSQRVLSAY